MTLRAVAALAVVVLVPAFVLADEAIKKQTDAKQSTGSAQPAGARADAKAGAGDAKPGSPSEARPARLTKPWRDLASLSEDQKRQINQIHRKTSAEVKALEQRERDDIMALLSDQQKAEVKAMMEKDAAEKKAKAAEKSKAGAKVSQRSAGSDRADAASQEAEADDDAVVETN